MCALLLAVGGNAAAGAGSGTLRNLFADSRGRDEQFQNHVADPPNCGCVRPARDRHTKPESGRRVGGQDHDLMGTRQRASRAVDFPAAKRRYTGARLGKHGTFRRGRDAVPRSTDGKAAGLDAEHERNRDRASSAAGPARIGAADGCWI